MARMKLLLLFALLLPTIGAQAQSGIRWSDPTRIAASSYGNQHPRIAYDRSNTPLVIWGRAMNLCFSLAGADRHLQILSRLAVCLRSRPRHGWAHR
jgi:hypothetical protein